MWQAIMTAVGLIGALGLFVSLKLEMESRLRRERERVETILSRLNQAEKPVLKSGFNLAQRPQLTRREAELAERVSALAGERIC
jgi:hypothetical protein